MTNQRGWSFVISIRHVHRTNQIGARSRLLEIRQPARCVRCGALHTSLACPNPQDAAPRFALCSGDHPSKNKGCSVYKDLQQRNKPKKSNLLSDYASHKKNVQVSQPVVTPSTHPPDSSQTYAQATSFNPNNTIPPPVSDINKFLEEFNLLINPLIALLTQITPLIAVLQFILNLPCLFQSLPNFCQPHLQSCAILQHLNNIPTTLAAIYSLSRHNINIKNYIDYFSTFSQNFIIGGDFNAKHLSWGCRTNNPRGMVLYNFINLKGYKILARPGPTYWPTSLRKKPDILDIFVSNTPHNLFCQTTNLLEPCSDHSAIFLTISACPPIRPSLPKLFLHSTN
ncbi:Uncharacterized protein FWK35_00030742 [Aphis craccivora]|uniref:Endonuclease/exonuclease/phosphatase domain-containing protein n=1 Tax=Aphis craccivora TaxID=307492 RepID=A0A6G0Y9E5_APHCR|nr:Uncharacterized protein FWK35_00030742 [Aphis craccivora]